MKKLVLALLALFASPVVAQQPNWLTGVYTLAPGADNIYTNFPPSAYCYYIAWVSDRPGGQGYMVSNCSAWVSDQGPQGATGAPGSTGSAGTNGTNGTNGSAATVTVGSVSPLAPGSTPTVTNSGTTSAAVFNFGLTTGNTGANGTAGVNAFGSPNSRSVSLATAYQATDTAKPAVVSVNLTSTAALSLTGGTSNSATVVIGATNAVASGTGTTICNYANTNTGALTIGLALSTTAASTCTFALPTGWFFAVRQTAGTVSISSTYDQSVG